MALRGQLFYRCCETRAGHALLRAAVGALRGAGFARRFLPPVDCLSLPHDAVRELMRLWRRLPWSGGDGMMTEDERLLIFALAFACPVDGDVVELGSWKGLTTCYLAAACRARGRGRVLAVDTFEGTREHGTQYEAISRYDGSTLPAFEEMVRRAGVSDVVTPCVGYTTEAADRYREGQVAFLLIDADHSYEGVKADYESWLPHVAPGGTMVFHDYAMEGAGVRDFVDNEVTRDTRVESRPGHVLRNVFAVTKGIQVPPPESTNEPARHAAATRKSHEPAVMATGRR